MGVLKMDERLLAFTIAWVLAPRESYHTQLSKDDMVLIFKMTSN